MRALAKIFFFLWLFSFICLLATELPPSIPLKIPMRDGVSLTADLYLPTGNEKNLPCVLIRSPAGRQNPYALLHLSLLKEGYAVAIQETRSALDLEGKTLPYESDGWGELQDGYDTVSYLSKCPYTNGKIATVGSSALGITQLLLAPTCPKGLKAQYISFATSDLFNHGLYQGGELHKHQVEGWLSLYAKDPSVYKTIYTQPIYNAFWEKFNMLPLAGQCEVPAMHLGGWYDTFLSGTLSAFVAMQNQGGQGAKGHQKLVIGPWIHLWPLVTDFGDFSYPQTASQPPFDFSTARWFKEHFKQDPDLKNWPNVLYYVMGPFDGSTSSGNVWKTAESWPIPTETTFFYLTHSGHLSEKLPTSGKTTFSSDPSNPVPTLGGRNLFLPSGPTDQSLLLERNDVLKFSTDPLLEDLEVTGHLKATLYVNTDKEDTSFALRLVDIYQDGKHILIADGISRLSSSLKLRENKASPIALDIDLIATSIVFAKGHRIGVLISGSNYPKFEKNFNTLKRAHENPIPEIANNQIFTGSPFASKIELPVVKPLIVP